MRKQFVVAAVLLIISAASLLAHDLFLKLDSYFVPPNTAVRVAVLNGTFSSSEGAVAPDRLLDLSIVGPVRRRPIPRTSWKQAGDTSWLSIQTGAAGTYVIGASLSPRQIALSGEDFNSYLKEDGIPDVLDARTRDGELRRAVRERYQKHVKAILQVGDARSDAYAVVLGYPAEIVPLQNPYRMRLGDTLAVRSLVDGKPSINQLVIAGGERDGCAMEEVRARSDSTGIARFALRVPGKWYIKFINMTPVTGDSVNYESKWATLTFEVQAAAQGPLGAPWDSVGKILRTSGTLTGCYYRYGWPRRDITLRVGDVTVSPALALGAWAGFSGDAGDATMMGDLVLTSGELKSVLAELVRQRIAVTAIHNHIGGEEPQITYVHFHDQGNALDLATRLDRVLALTGTPRPVMMPSAGPVTIDTALIFATLGLRGRAQGNVVQISTVLVPGHVMLHGRPLNPAQAYGSPINIQLVAPERAVATGDFAVLGSKVGPVFGALTANGIPATAIHTHVIGEEPKIYYLHFWADGSLTDVLRGLRAALDAAR